MLLIRKRVLIEGMMESMIKKRYMYICVCITNGSCKICKIT